MIRIILRENVSPDDATDFRYQTMDVDIPKLEEWLTDSFSRRSVVGVEIIEPEARNA